MEEFKFNSKINGSTFVDPKQTALKSLSVNQVLKLVREHDNQYDKNAVAIYNDETKLGYIPTGTAQKIAKDVEAGNVICTVAEITGGTTDKSNTGCNILLIVERKDEKN